MGHGSGSIGSAATELAWKVSGSVALDRLDRAFLGAYVLPIDLASTV